MMRHRNLLRAATTLTTLVWLWTPGSVLASSFVQLFEAARSIDPQYAAARAERMAVETLPKQARGQLLPQLSFSSGRSKNNVSDDQHLSTGSNRSTPYEYFSTNASLNLSLAVLRPQPWIALAQSKAQVRQAEAIFRQAEQDLILRFSQAYFDFLLAQDTVKYVEEQKAAVMERLRQSRRFFEAGFGTLTDINEAQARLDVVLAQEIAARNDLLVKRRALEMTVGQDPADVALLGERMALESPAPEATEAWIEFAMSNNPQLKAKEAAHEVAEREVHKSQAAHLPTVDIVASRSRADNPSYTYIDHTNWSKTIGVQVAIPLFSGGTTRARTQQAEFQSEKAKAEVDGARRSVTLAVQQEYLNVVSGIAQVRATTQAVRSNEVALYSAQRGHEAGLRTSFDVLNAQSLLYDAKRQLAQAKYKYVLARLRLRSAAGLLGEEDIGLVQSWLGDKDTGN